MQKEAESKVLEDVLRDCSWSRKVRDDTVKVVELSQMKNGQTSFQLVPGEYDGDCEVRLACDKENSFPSGKAPLPRWIEPIPVRAAPTAARNMEVEELKREE